MRYLNNEQLLERLPNELDSLVRVCSNIWEHKNQNNKNLQNNVGFFDNKPSFGAKPSETFRNLEVITNLQDGCLKLLSTLQPVDAVKSEATPVNISSSFLKPEEGVKASASNVMSV